ncbi:RNA polymerase sigma factor [Phosphitispora sp. TUW77]|uniref:RNA polymerase sigma factor n=1 Tax=Phosphitispora sp. TUW77 TaxID=3152361 RepID=UPI003AB4D823
MNISDEALIDKIKQGDLDAFEKLISNYETKVYTIAYRYFGNYNDASDLAQEALIKVYRSINTFRGESSFSTWLYRVVTNVCKDELRRRARPKTVSIDEMIEDGKSPGVETKCRPIEEIVIRKELQDEVQEALNSLTEDFRTIVIMRDIQGYSYEEISSFLECSMGTVKSRLNRARNALKERLLERRDLFMGTHIETIGRG